MDSEGRVWNGSIDRFLLIELSTMDANEPQTTDPAIERALSTLSPELHHLLAHPLRRRILRALHTERVPSPVSEILSREGLSGEASSRLNYHARQLVDAGAVEVVDELPVYRSQLASDPAVLACLQASAADDAREAT
jgi:DNA-binding transcriptional ArsR family regulator